MLNSFDVLECIKRTKVGFPLYNVGMMVMLSKNVMNSAVDVFTYLYATNPIILNENWMTIIQTFWSTNTSFFFVDVKRNYWLVHLFTKERQLFGPTNTNNVNFFSYKQHLTPIHSVQTNTTITIHKHWSLWMFARWHLKREENLSWLYQLCLEAALFDSSGPSANSLCLL